MKILSRPLLFRILLIATMVAFVPLTSMHAQPQAGGRFYLSPELGLGITSSYDPSPFLHLDLSHPDRNVRLELRAGYWLNNNVSLLTGLGYASYHYRLAALPADEGGDTSYRMSQEYWEVPLLLRLSTYHGRSVKTRYYAAAGIRACFQSDARHDFKTNDGNTGENVVRSGDVNPFWLRAVVEAGLDIPMDYGSAVLIGVNFSQGLSRNTCQDGPLGAYRFGLPVVGASIGLRIGLTQDKPAPHRRPQRGRYR